MILSAGFTGQGYGAGMVAARSTAWRVAAARPSLGQRDRAVRLPPQPGPGCSPMPRRVAAYHARVHRRGPGERWFWLGPISDTGAAMGGGVIAAPVLSWQLSRGLLRPVQDGRLPVIRHTCDESACCNPAHWVRSTSKDNAADYTARKGDPFSPLADRRGPAGRARAIRDAILRAQAHGVGGGAVDKAIKRAMSAGMPGVQDQLF
jgi:hypothetical protein